MQTEDEDFLGRPKPSRPYRPTALRLAVPTAAVIETLALLQKAGRRESGVFWYGLRDAAGNGEVTSVAAPRQNMRPLNFHVTPEAMGQLVFNLKDGLKPLAQIHSHPGHGVEHSRYDDKMMNNPRVLSIVFPRYGHLSGTFPAGCGVHQWQMDYWHLLGSEDAARRVVLTDGRVDVADYR